MPLPRPMPRTHAPARRHRCAFTIIELLVVIGVVAILLVLILPLLSMARKRAQSAECAANLRQLVMMVETYASENQSLYPPRLGAPDGLAHGPAPSPGPLGPTYGGAAVLPARAPASPADYRAATSRDPGGDVIVFQPGQPAARWVAATSYLHAEASGVQPGTPEQPVDPFPIARCPTDPAPSGPGAAAANFLPPDRIARSYMFNGFNDALAATPWEWSPAAAYAVRRDSLLQAAATTLFAEKMSGPNHAAFYVDIFADWRNPLAHVEQARHPGSLSNYAYADASVRAAGPNSTLQPTNVWALRRSVREWTSVQPYRPPPIPAN